MVPEYLYETVEPDNSVLLQNGSHGQADRQTGKKIISRIHWNAELRGWWMKLDNNLIKQKLINLIAA